MVFIFPTINLKETGNNLVCLMKKNNLTVKDLQNIFGFESPQAIYKWIWGKSIPSIDNLVILSKLFHLSIDQILIITDK